MLTFPKVGGIILAGLLVATLDVSLPFDNEKMQVWRRPGFLRGANVLVSHEHQPTPVEFRALQKDGANLVQLSIEGIQRTDPPFGEDTVASRRLAQAVHDALTVGLSVVIAVRTGPGLTDVAVEAQTPGLQSKVWVDTTARREFIRMWQRIATTFGGEARVVGYNLIVEPLPEAAVGGPSSRPDSDWSLLQNRGIDWPTIANTIVAGIRTVDQRTPVVVEATGFSRPKYFAFMRPIQDSQAIYDVHQYEPHAYTTQVSEDASRARKGDTLSTQWLRQTLAPVADLQRRAGHPPVFVGEFGVVRNAPGAATFIARQTALFDSLGWHSAVWIWACCGAMAVYDPPADSSAQSILQTLKRYWTVRQ